MSRYAEKNLIKDEHIVLKAKINPLYIFKYLFWAAVLIVLGIFLPTIVEAIIDAINGESAAADTLSGATSALASASGEVAGSSMSAIVFYVGIALIVIGVIVLLCGIIFLLSMSLAVTNKRIIGKVGVLKVHSLDLPIEKVDSVEIKATLLGRIFRWYYVLVKSPGQSLFRFPAVSNATQFKNTVTATIEKHAEEARKAQAAEIAAAMRAAQNMNGNNNNQ